MNQQVKWETAESLNPEIKEKVQQLILKNQRLGSIMLLTLLLIVVVLPNLNGLKANWLHIIIDILLFIIALILMFRNGKIHSNTIANNKFVWRIGEITEVFNDGSSTRRYVVVDDMVKCSFPSLNENPYIGELVIVIKSSEMCFACRIDES